MSTYRHTVAIAQSAVWIVLALALPPTGLGAPPVTFAHDIAPIVYKYCSTCHRPGQAAPFPLLTYEDVKKHATSIAASTRSRSMPPWLPEPGYGQFADERRLSDAQIRKIVRWVNEGAPEGPASEIPPAPRFTTSWQLGEPDMILEADRPYSPGGPGSPRLELPLTGGAPPRSEFQPDVFWDFFFRPDIKTTRYVRAVEVHPGNSRIVHHTNLLVDRRPRLDVPPAAGFPGMDRPDELSLFDPDEGRILFWEPGKPPNLEPDGMAWRLDPGNTLVLNTHLRPILGKIEQVRPSIGLYFTDKLPDRIPMMIHLEHDHAIDIQPGDSDFVVSDDFRLPFDVDVLAIYPHMHFRGKAVEAYATLPGESRKWLIRIPDWDYERSEVYRYREPVFLPKGSTISMRFHYDNSAANQHNPIRPPQHVVSGQDLMTNEKGHLWLQVLPRGGGDRRMELEEALMRHRLEKYPDDFWAHLRLGALMLARHDAPGAVPMTEAAVRIQPDNPESLNLLGIALDDEGHTEEAVQQFDHALRLRPDYANARFNLGNALFKLGRLDEAIGHFNNIIAVYPGDSLTTQHLALALKARAVRP